MLDPYDGDDLLELYINVKVTNPKLDDCSHVSYEIIIETNNFSFNKRKSAVRRRFSDFVVLYKLISKEFPAMKTPNLPPKYPFRDHYDLAFIENRRKELEEFIKKIVSQKIYLSSKALHLFLQTTYTMAEIQDIIQGKNVLTEPQFGSVNNGFSSFYTVLNYDSGPSSHAELEISGVSSSTTQNLSNELPNVSSKCDSPMGSKKVSFCEQVTVAQLH